MCPSMSPLPPKPRGLGTEPDAPTKFWKRRSISARSRERSWKSKSGIHSPIRRPPVTSSVDAGKRNGGPVEPDPPVHDREVAAAADRDPEAAADDRDRGARLDREARRAVGVRDPALGPAQRRRERRRSRETGPRQLHVAEEALDRDPLAVERERHRRRAPVSAGEVLDAVEARKRRRPRSAPSRCGRPGPPVGPSTVASRSSIGKPFASSAATASRPAIRKPPWRRQRELGVARGRRRRNRAPSGRCARPRPRGARPRHRSRTVGVLQVLDRAGRAQLAEIAVDAQGVDLQARLRAERGSARSTPNTSGSSPGSRSVVRRQASDPR